MPLPIRALGAIAAYGLAAGVPVAAAQGGAPGPSYPSRPIRFIVPLPPGGGADLVARLLGERLGKRLGQQVVIDNRPGAGTVIGADLASKAPADGHTLLLGTATTHAINASLVPKLPYDPVRDFTPVTLVAILAQILVSHPSLPVKTLQELIDHARAHPGAISFASTGNGSANHLAGEMLKAAASIDMVHVPYRGAAPSMTDLLSGQIKLTFSTIPPALGHIRSGRLRVLAIANAKRSTLMPEVPTTAEGGAPGVEASSWNGVLVPAGTPAAIVQVLLAEITAIMQTAEVRERLATAGVEPAGSTPAEFVLFMRQETARYAAVIRSARVKID